MVVMGQLGPYELRGVLGRGAMARVWRAWDPILHREVALKEPLYDPSLSNDVIAEMERRFVSEGRIGARLSHPGIVAIHAADVWDGRAAIVMELVEGETLASRLTRGPLTPTDALAAADQLLDALGYAHANGVVHRDIKPDNIFITKDGRIKLSDFGIAHVMGGATAVGTIAGTVLGTPGYMSPEQAKGLAVDARSDLFSVGIVLYEMLTGRNPFSSGEGDDATTLLYRIVNEPAPELPSSATRGLPFDIKPVVARALSKRPEDRPQSADEFRVLLRGQTMNPANYGEGDDADRRAVSWLPYAIVVVVALVLFGFALQSAFSGGGGGSHSGGAQTQRGTTTKPSYYLAESNGYVAIFEQGSGSPVEVSDLLVSELGSEGAGVLDGQETVATLDDARLEIERLRNEAGGSSQDSADDEANDTVGGYENVPVRASLSQYSWEELALIAQDIEQCDNAADGIDLAKRYNLLGAQGKYLDVTKDLALTNGEVLHMRLIGVCHDKAETRSGVAALSFLSDDVMGNYQMSSSKSYGGWESSLLRGRLQDDVLSLLPGEIASSIIPAIKSTNNVGMSKSSDCVSETSESLWIPSVVELCGPVSWAYEADQDNSANYNAILNAEGSQYPAFEQMGIGDSTSNSVLSHGGEWWLRSPSPLKGTARYVSGDGNPSYYGLGDKSRGVAFGFCL